MLVLNWNTLAIELQFLPPKGAGPGRMAPSSSSSSKATFIQVMIGVNWVIPAKKKRLKKLVDKKNGGFLSRPHWLILFWRNGQFRAKNHAVDKKNGGFFFFFFVFLQRKKKFFFFFSFCEKKKVIWKIIIKKKRSNLKAGSSFKKVK